MRKLINADGWLEQRLFVRVDGHPLKVYSQPNTGENGLACHSVVGEEADFLDGVPARFLDDSRNPDGSFTDNAAASCMFILRKRMPHVVMYPFEAATWTSGGWLANTTTWAMEAEGGGYLWRDGRWVPNFSEPLTAHQELGFLIIATAWEQVHGRSLEVGRTVREHRQIASEYGYAATACASGRYANAWARLAAGERYTEDDMTPDEVRAIVHGELAMALAIDNNDDVRIAHFRRLLDLATNGGEGQFADADGNPLTLIRDRDMLARVEALEAANEDRGVPAGLPARARITSGELEFER